MNTKELDGNTLQRLLQGGADEIQRNVEIINNLNVFPVPDGDTGTNMCRTIESGIAGIKNDGKAPLGEVAKSFARASLLGARGNSGVILSQFFAGMCEALQGKLSASAKELADAYIEGVKRSYSAVAKPVEGTILTVFRESAEYARDNMAEDATIEDFLSLNIEQAERTLEKTKEMLPVLTEADVVDSGGAGYLCIAKGMYSSLLGELKPRFEASAEAALPEIDYELFTTDSTLEFGYCTECLVRLQRAKGDPERFSESDFVSELEALSANSIVALRDGDILKVHAHTEHPQDILALCQRFGEFLQVKIENMSLQHSERTSKGEEALKKKVHKRYGIVTVATGEGLISLFSELGADAVINGGQTSNPSADEFLQAFGELDCDDILVFPNNSNILLTASQAAELYTEGRVTVIPTRTVPEGYTALSVFNAAITDLDEQISDITAAIDAVTSLEVTVAIRDTVIGGVEVLRGEYIGILEGELVSSKDSAIEAMCEALLAIEDLDERELITVFVGEGVSDEERVLVTETLEERFPDLAVTVYIGGQKIYNYLISVE